MGVDLLLIIILGSAFLIFQFFTLPTIYQLQIKEYYWPRVSSSFREWWIGARESSSFNARGFFIPLKFPAKTPRNLAIFLFAGLANLFYYTLLFFYVRRELVLLESISFPLLVVAGTLLSKFATVLGMAITHPVAMHREHSFVERAKKYIERSDTVFIGVTGSYGKSSVKEFIAQLLSTKFKVGKTYKNYNTRVGVALSVIRNLADDTRFFVAEMAAYRKGMIAQSAQVVNPKYGVLTGIGNQHIDIFGSQENIVSAKSELLYALPDDGLAIINLDTPFSAEIASKLRCRVATYSMKQPDATVYADKVRFNGAGYDVTLCDGFAFHLPLLGKHNVANILPAIILGRELGMSDEEVRSAISQIRQIESKLKLAEGVSGAMFLDDSYNSNTAGFASAVQLLNEIGESAGYEQLYLLSKGIIELGGDKERSYKEILDGVDFAKVRFVTTDLLFQKVEPRVELMNSESEMLQFVKQNARKGSLFLLEGRFSPEFMKSLNLNE